MSGDGMVRDVPRSVLGRAYDYARKKVSRTITGAKYAAAGLAILTALTAIEKAHAAPLGDPLLSLPAESIPTGGFAAPNTTLYGNLTGADGDVTSPIWYLVTDDGYIHTCEGNNLKPGVDPIFTGVTGASGICITPNGLAISQGTDIYEGRIVGGAWILDDIVGLTGFTSDTTDVDWFNGSYFVSTLSDGIRRVESDGSTTHVGSGTAYAVDFIGFLPNTYDNLMQQLTGEFFNNVDEQGNQIGGSKTVDMNNVTTIQAVAYYNGGMAIIQKPGVNIHNPLAYHQHMAPTVVLYNLSASERNGTMGNIEVYLYGDPNLVEDPNLTIAVRSGGQATFTAVPNPDRSFRHWEIYDNPNLAGDANYADIDSNNPMTITIDSDMHVIGAFKCGSGLEMGLPLLAALCCMSVLPRRRHL